VKIVAIALDGYFNRMPMTAVMVNEKIHYESSDFVLGKYHVSVEFIFWPTTSLDIMKCKAFARDKIVKKSGPKYFLYRTFTILKKDRQLVGKSLKHSEAVKLNDFIYFILSIIHAAYTPAPGTLAYQ
jgi:hypothetical protein